MSIPPLARSAIMQSVTPLRVAVCRSFQGPRGGCIPSNVSPTRKRVGRGSAALRRRSRDCQQQTLVAFIRASLSSPNPAGNSTESSTLRRGVPERGERPWAATRRKGAVEGQGFRRKCLREAGTSEDHHVSPTSTGLQ